MRISILGLRITQVSSHIAHGTKLPSQARVKGESESIGIGPSALRKAKIKSMKI